jgi:hypothetical protein
VNNRILRRPRRLNRPVAVAIAAVVGLGGLGGAAGALLGELGAAGASVHRDEGRHHDVRFRGVAHLRGDGNVAGNAGSGPLP